MSRSPLTNEVIIPNGARTTANTARAAASVTAINHGRLREDDEVLIPWTRIPSNAWPSVRPNTVTGTTAYSNSHTPNVTALTQSGPGNLGCSPKKNCQK